MMSMNLSINAILSTKDAYYCCIISRISKSEVINLMQNIDLIEKSGNYKKHKNLLKRNIRINFRSYKFTLNTLLII